MKSVYLRYIQDRAFLVPSELISYFDKDLLEIAENEDDYKKLQDFIEKYFKYRVNDIKSIKLWIEN